MLEKNKQTKKITHFLCQISLTAPRIYHPQQQSDLFTCGYPLAWWFRIRTASYFALTLLRVRSSSREIILRNHELQNISSAFRSVFATVCVIQTNLMRSKDFNRTSHSLHAF